MVTSEDVWRAMKDVEAAKYELAHAKIQDELDIRRGISWPPSVPWYTRRVQSKVERFQQLSKTYEQQVRKQQERELDKFRLIRLIFRKRHS